MKTKPIRFKLVSHMCDNVSYLTIVNGKVNYFNGHQIPLALSNVAGNNAAELVFALEDVSGKPNAVEHSLYYVKKFCDAKSIEII